MTIVEPVADNPIMGQKPDSEDNNTDQALVVDSTIVVGRGASLTLGTDSLTVLDDSSVKGNCCGGLWSSGSASTRAIPFYNILWAEISPETGEITIHYALSISKAAVKVSALTYAVEESDRQRAGVWIAELLDRAYGKSQKRKRAKVLINPCSGKGKAEKLYYRHVLPILTAAKCDIDMAKTKYRGEATDIAEKIDIEAYDIIVACSGDGLVYETFNGLGKRPDAKRALGRISVVHIPCGSGNAMSYNVNGTDSPSLATLAIVKGIQTPLDLMSITQGNNRTLSFLSQSLGIVAETDLSTEHLRWIGQARFTYGFLVRVLRKNVYPCDIAIQCAMEDKASIKEHYKKALENQEPASERRGNESVDLGDDSVSGTDSGSEGLPPLRYGTVNDKLPDGWEMVSYDRLGNFYCGNMAYMATDAEFFSSALPNDGYMDLICVDGDISRLASIRMLKAVENNKLFDMPLVNYRKISAYRIIPKSKGGCISIDGERVPFQPFQVEIHRGLGTTLSKTGRIYEAPGPV